MSPLFPLLNRAVRQRKQLTISIIHSCPQLKFSKNVEYISTIYLFIEHVTASIKYEIFMWRALSARGREGGGERERRRGPIRFHPFARYLSFDVANRSPTLRSLLTRHLRLLVNSINRARRCGIAGTIGGNREKEKRSLTREETASGGSRDSRRYRDDAKLRRAASRKSQQRRRIIDRSGGRFERKSR